MEWKRKSEKNLKSHDLKSQRKREDGEGRIGEARTNPPTAGKAQEFHVQRSTIRV
jgi:hypothetical protein